MCAISPAISSPPAILRAVPGCTSRFEAVTRWSSSLAPLTAPARFEATTTTSIPSDTSLTTSRLPSPIRSRSTSLFSEIAPGETVTADVTLKNTGTRRLDNVRLWTEQASGWRTIVEPDVIPAIDKDREQRVKLSIFPAESVAVGDYEVRIKTESFAYNRRVPAEEKIYRLSVKGRTHLLGILSLMVLLLALGTGIVIVGVKLARR